MTARNAFAAALVCMSAASAFAQTNRTPAPARGSGGLLPPAAVPTTPNPQRAAPPPRSPAPSAPPSGNGQSVNVKVEFTIADQRANEAPIKRTVSVIAADRNLGRVRSAASILGVQGDVPLNVDATPTLLSDGKIKLQFTLSYDWPAPFEPPAQANTPPPLGRIMRTMLQDSVSLILTDGEPMVAAQSADPVGDRQVTVEVKATVLK